MGIFDFFRKKQQRPDTGVKADPTRHCFVLCEYAEPYSLRKADSTVKRVFGQDHTAEVEEGDNPSLTVMRGKDALGVIAHIPIPIPNGEADEHANGNILWLNGKQAASEHRSHAIVTFIGNGIDESPISSALGVARMTLVALETFDGIGVYWGNGSVTNSREMFEKTCEGMSEQHVPLPVMLRFQLFKPSESTFGLYTLGMSQFGLMDLEVERSNLDPEALLYFVADLAHYLVQSGPVIEDGNTVGGSEEERITVKHLPSMIDENRMVYKVVMD